MIFLTAFVVLLSAAPRAAAHEGVVRRGSIFQRPTSSTLLTLLGPVDEHVALRAFHAVSQIYDGAIGAVIVASDGRDFMAFSTLNRHGSLVAQTSLEPGARPSRVNFYPITRNFESVFRSFTHERDGDPALQLGRIFDAVRRDAAQPHYVDVAIEQNGGARMQRFAVRRASAQDIPRLIQIWKDTKLFWPAGDRVEALKAMFAHDADSALVLEHEKNIVGVVLSIFSPWYSSVWHGAIDPAWQGRGLFSLLLEEASSRLWKRGAHAIGGYIEPQNERSLNVLKSFGFEVEGPVLPVSKIREP